MGNITVQPYFGRKRNLRLFRTRYVIGSDLGCDIHVDDPFICPRHAEIRLSSRGDGYGVFDLGSKNGVFVNGVRVTGAPLPRRGALRIGRSLLSWSDGDGGWEESEGLVVADPFMRETVARLRHVAPSSLSVLITGETGTGKDLLARLLHAESPRAQGPYVALNGALTGGSLAESQLFGHRKGAFTGADGHRAGALRSAHGGTLFLDEIADIPLSAQVGLLRALESGEVRPLGSDRAEHVDFRLVSATSQDIERRMQEGSFRMDLYFRLAGFVVHVPPLRERPRDILAIATRCCAVEGFDLDEECEGILLSYPWPGNVRELLSQLERGMVLARGEGAPRLLPAHLRAMSRDPAPRPPAFHRGRTLEEVERACIHESLERNGWARIATARELGIARSTLFEKMRRYGLRDKADATAR